MMRFFVDFNHHRRLRCHRKNFSLLLPQMRDIEIDRKKKMKTELWFEGKIIRVYFITQTASFHGCRIHEIDKQKYLL